MIETTKALREKGLKVTPQRIAIHAALAATKSHPSAEEIYKALMPTNPTISLATVYKTLDSFKATGLIQELSVGNGRNNYDVETKPHPHMVCTCCHKIYDFETDMDKYIASMREDIYAQTEFFVEYEQLIFYGMCKECKESKLELQASGN